MMNRARNKSFLLIIGLFATGLLLAGCGGGGGGGGGGDGDGGATPQIPTSDWISAVSTVGGEPGTFSTSGPPEATDGPCIAVTAPSIVIIGGSVIVNISSDATFTELFVTVANATGYYKIVLPGAVMAEDIVLTFQQQLPSVEFTLNFQGADAASSAGCVETVPVSATTVNAGDLQVSVSWDAPSDVDLHVVEPSGEEIYYGNPLSATGGELDLDSNAACSIDGVNNENISWPVSSPPDGTYTVRVDYWNSCDETETNFIVTVQIIGQIARTFSGTFTGAGDSGGPGAGVTITQFTFPEGNFFNSVGALLIDVNPQSGSTPAQK